jgi:hypothetical protein
VPADRRLLRVPGREPSLAIAVNTEKGWITFSIFMTVAAVNPAAAWLTHRNARHATAPAPSPAPHRQSSIR